MFPQKTVSISSKVVQELMHRQGELSDGEFAKNKLGITRTQWAYLKSGKRQPGKKFYSAVKTSFPDLIPLILMEM